MPVPDILNRHKDSERYQFNALAPVAHKQVIAGALSPRSPQESPEITLRLAPARAELLIDGELSAIGNTAMELWNEAMKDIAHGCSTAEEAARLHAEVRQYASAAFAPKMLIAALSDINMLDCEANPNVVLNEVDGLIRDHDEMNEELESIALALDCKRDDIIETVGALTVK